MPDGPDVRALRHLLSADANGYRPARCTVCPFSRPTLILGGRVGCDLLGLPEVNHERPPCTAEDWGGRAREDLARLESEVARLGADNALLAAVARDAREESLMYRRGLAEGAAAEREACCKAACRACAAGVPLRRHPGDEGWFHDRGDGVRVEGCRADRIRRRAEGDGR